MSESQFPEEAAEPQLSEQVLLDLIAEGQRALGQGRLEEALSRAESVLEEAPDFVPALALKGDALEKLGDMSGALAACERVLELKPDSALDRIRATHLRRMAPPSDLEVEETPPRGMALMTAGAAFVLFVTVCWGVWSFGQSQPARTNGQQVAQITDEPTMSTFPGVPPVPTADQTAVPDAAAQEAPSAAAQMEPDESTLSDRPGYTPPPRPSSGSRVVAQANPPLERVDPVNPIPGGIGPVSIQPAPSSPTSAAATAPAQPTTPPPAAQSSGQEQADAPEVLTSRRTDRSVVEIRPSAGSEQSGKSGGGSEPVAPDSPDARTSAEVLIRTARDAFVRGDYGRASDAYEKALARGASRGSTNQRLAQCYERLGRKGDAIAAYERAVAAYQSQLAGGGDNSRIQAALDSSRQALKNLRG